MRGKVGRVYGDLTAMLTILKGLPLTYNRDLQEDKEPFLDADHTLSTSLELMAGMMKALRFDEVRMARALTAGFLNATELADYLVTKGIPFREAHHITGSAVALAEGKNLSQPCRLTRFRACAIASAPMCSTCSNTAPPSPAGTPPAAPARCPWRASWKR